MTTVQKTIFKILTNDQWVKFQMTGRFIGTDLDIKSGYIHMSETNEQVNRVKQKYYEGVKIFLLHIDQNKLNNLKYEVASDGSLYPHQYGELVIGDVIETELL
jgi:uncharacterized protein (DUF952 family)